MVRGTSAFLLPPSALLFRVQPGARATSAEIRAELVRDYAELEQQVKQLNVKLN